MLRAAVGRAAARSGGGAGLREPFSAAAATNPNSAPAAPNSTSAKSAASPSSKKQKKPRKLDPSHHRHFSLSPSSASAPSSAFNNPPWPPPPPAATSGVMLPTWRPYPSAPQHDDSEWVYVDGNGEIAVGYIDDLVLGPVPSKCEVENAVSALQQ